jgi:hypothetical protein
MPRLTHRSVICLCIISASISQLARADDFDNGLINDIDHALPGGARVYDSSTGDTTTINALSGAVINGIEANDSSVVKIFDGSQITSDLNANDTSMVSVLGGSLINVDALNGCELTISGGIFSGSGGRAVGAFDDAVVNITGGEFLGATTFTLLSNENSTINVSGGSIDGEIRSNNDSMINIWGGTGISDVTAVEHSIMKIYGLDFSIESLGAVSLNSPFVISDETYNGELLTGTLADGSAISADILNGVVGSKIVLVAVPDPASIWLVGSSLLGLFGFSRRKAT